MSNYKAVTQKDKRGNVIGTFNCIKHAMEATGISWRGISNMFNGYRHEYDNLDEVVKELNFMLNDSYKRFERRWGKNGNKWQIKCVKCASGRTVKDTDKEVIRARKGGVG